MLSENGANLKFILKIGLFFLIFSMNVLRTEAQAKCDKICSDDYNCNSGRCILTQCSDLPDCFQYCLNCAGLESCYGSGSACNYTANIVRLGSSTLKYSVSLGATTLFTTFAFFKLLKL